MRAELNYLRIAPRKVRLAADPARNKPVSEAISILKFSPKKGARHILKLLNSAVSSARKNFSKEPDNLYISKLTVNEGPVFKRYSPRARGMAAMIRKKTSHVSITLSELPAKKPSSRAHAERLKTLPVKN
ncbi:MAG: 50S ribosomal protein L22 [Patescibacteria group bacterium]